MTDTTSPTKDAATEPETTEPPKVSDDFVHRTHTHKPSGLDYTTTTGRLVIRHEGIKDGNVEAVKPKAEIFITAYTANLPEGTNPASRPVTFAFNGGPGSASLWLHLGLLGPRRVDSGDVGNLTPPPFGITDNVETLLKHSDLVMIDPVNTGYSRVVEGGKADEFHAFVEDRDLVAEVIRLWTTRNNRWLSPKYLVGESYGTLRAVAVAGRLFDAYGMAVNGLGLISSVLNLSTVSFPHGANDAYPLHLPTYAAIAHYHGLLPDKTLEEAVRDAEEFARKDFTLALAEGNRLAPEAMNAVVLKIAELTALSPEFIRRKNLRWTYIEFAHELLREKGLMVGRIDGRFSFQPSDLQASDAYEDPSIDAITGPYAAAINHYIRSELGYENDLPYEVLSGRVQPWSYRTFEGEPIDVSRTLERLMVRNPHLRVHVDYGYYDGATPHFAAEFTFAQLQLSEDAKARFSHHYHEAGHMMYLLPEAREAQLAALADFVRVSGGEA